MTKLTIRLHYCYWFVILIHSNWCAARKFAQLSAPGVKIVCETLL